MGFLTGTTPGNIQDLSDGEVVNVFIPWALGPTSGLLVFVPRRDVKPVDMTVEEALKLSISAGLAKNRHRAQNQKSKKGEIVSFTPRARSFAMFAKNHP